MLLLPIPAPNAKDYLGGVTETGAGSLQQSTASGQALLQRTGGASGSLRPRPLRRRQVVRWRPVPRSPPSATR